MVMKEAHLLLTINSGRIPLWSAYIAGANAHNLSTREYFQELLKDVTGFERKPKFRFIPRLENASVSYILMRFISSYNVDFKNGSSKKLEFD